MRYEPVYVQDVFLEHPLLYISIFIIGLLLYKLINRRKDKPSGSSTPPSAPTPPIFNNGPKAPTPPRQTYASAESSTKVFRADHSMAGNTLRGETLGVSAFRAGDKAVLFNEDGKIIGQANVTRASENELVLIASDGKTDCSKAEIVINAPAWEEDYDTAVVSAMKEKGRSMRMVQFRYDDRTDLDMSKAVVMRVDSIDRQAGTVEGPSLGLTPEKSREQGFDMKMSHFTPHGHWPLAIKSMTLTTGGGQGDRLCLTCQTDDVQIGDVISNGKVDDDHTLTCERLASWKHRLFYARVAEQEAAMEPLSDPAAEGPVTSVPAADSAASGREASDQAKAELIEKLIPAHDADSASTRLDHELKKMASKPNDQAFQRLVCAMVKEGLDGSSLYLPADANNAPLYFEFNHTRVYALYTDQTIAKACASACMNGGAAGSCVRVPLGKVIETANASAAIALNLGLPTQAILPPDVAHTIHYMKMVKELGAKEDDPSWASWFGILNGYLKDCAIFERSGSDAENDFLLGGSYQKNEVTLWLPIQREERDSQVVYQLVPEQLGLEKR